MTNFDRLRCALVAASCLIAACLPLPPPDENSRQPASSGWEQGPSTAESYDEQSGDGGGGGGGGQWLCTAQANVTTTGPNGQYSNSVERGLGGGWSRDEAYLQAQENCNALVLTEASLASSRDEIQSSDPCEVVDCIGPGR